MIYRFLNFSDLNYVHSFKLVINFRFRSLVKDLYLESVCNDGFEFPKLLHYFLKRVCNDGFEFPKLLHYFLKREIALISK